MNLLNKKIRQEISSFDKQLLKSSYDDVVLMQEQLDEATERWGVEVERVEMYVHSVVSDAVVW